MPPPYSPTQENETSQSPHTSPPDYHTIHEQLGYLEATTSVSSSSTHIKQEPVSDQWVNRTNIKGKQRAESSSSSGHGLFDDIRYDPRRGPIGNIFNIAEKFVGNAANAANVAIGAPPSPSPAEFGNNIARSATLMANNASRAAMGYVENIMGGQSSRREERKERREERREKREIKREQKKERRDCKRGGSGRRHSDGASSGSCSSSGSSGGSNNGLPGQSTTADCDNTERLEIIKSNTMLTLDESWSGRECHLKTSNGLLTVRGSLSASKSIQLESSNATLTVEGQILAGDKVQVRTTNGQFIVRGNSVVAKELDVQVSNAPLQFSSFIQAKRIYLKTKNAPITMGNISMGAELYAKTSNAPIEIHIVEIGSSSAKIEVESSNAPVNVYVPSTFSGYFSVKSNMAGSANVVAKSTEQSMIEYQVDERSKKQGTCKNFGNKSSIEISIKTSNAAATLYI